MKKHLIVNIIDDSIATELGIEAGDYLVKINGNEIEDALDYYLFVNDSYIEMEIEKAETGERYIYEIDKDDDEELGLGFENGLMDEYKSCTNNCMFCFIDQLPKGMRKTMYFKDDDSRLSFLQGNYITFTNIKEKDINRIIKYNMSPVNISVHTMNVELRKKMLNNRFAGKIIEHMDRLHEAGIVMNAQIVLCKGVNDGDELDYTIKMLSKYIPNLLSVSIVPVGITKFREGLVELEPYGKEDANNVIEIVEKWQRKLSHKHHCNLVHASDEFYFVAERELPSDDTYEGYLQLESGVGMTRVLLDTFLKCYNELEYSEEERVISLATGTLMGKVIKELISRFNEKRPNIKVNVYEIRNEFFGETITVSGLLTGQDIIKQLKGQELGEKLILPGNLLKADEEILLDDVSLTDIEEALDIKITIAGGTESDGYDLINALLL